MADVANYLSGADWNSMNGNVTTVGSAGLMSQSFYGTSDQGGNVFEWIERYNGDSSRGLYGGSVSNNASLMRASSGNGGPSANEFSNAGFHEATVPEPGTLCQAAFAGLALLAIRRRRSR